MTRRAPSSLFILGLTAVCCLLTAVCSADDALSRVRARGVLRIATDATYPPFEYMDGNNVVGFDREIGDELGKELGVKVQFIAMEWAGVFAAMEADKADLVMSGVTITEERKKGNAFSRPYFLSGQVVARRKGDTRIVGPDDLLKENRIAAVQSETTGQYTMEKRGMPKERIHRFDTLQDGILDTRNGKSDGAVGDLPAFKDIIRKGYPEMEVTSNIPFVEENLGIVARRDGLDLIAGINVALEHIMADGRYARIYAKWMKEPLPLATLAKIYAVRDAGTPIPPEIAAATAATLAKPIVAETEPSASRSAFTVRPDILKAALPGLLIGARLTLILTLLTLLIGVPLGLIVALCRLSRFTPLRALATAYIEIVRGTPLLTQIYVLYFVLPALGAYLPAFLSPLTALPAFASGLAALSLNAAAYVAEIFRAGIESIDVGQREASRALGMTGAQTMRHIILPQTVRRVLPPLTNEAVALLKDSSLVSVVSLSELMRVGKEFATNTGSPVTIYLAVACIYLAMTLPLTALVRRLESRWQFARRTPKGARP